MKFYLLVFGVLSITWSLTAQDSEGNPQNNQVEVYPPQILTKLNLNEPFTIDGYTLTFKSVKSDGRCPEQVTCVWAGEAKVLLEIDDGTDKQIYPVTIPAMGANRRIIATKQHKVYVKNLVPYPMTAEDSITAYQLVLKIDSM